MEKASPSPPLLIYQVSIDGATVLTAAYFQSRQAALRAARKLVTQHVGGPLQIQSANSHILVAAQNGRRPKLVARVRPIEVQA
jgi:hypothetical protein